MGQGKHKCATNSIFVSWGSPICTGMLNSNTYYLEKRRCWQVRWQGPSSAGAASVQAHDPVTTYCASQAVDDARVPAGHCSGADGQ